MNSEFHRLELEVERNIAFIEYKLDGDTLFLIHTEVPAAKEKVGQCYCPKGITIRKRQKLQNSSYMSFWQSYLKRHKEWNNMVVPDAERFIRKH